MPSAEIDIDPELVRGLLRDQHPDLADLPIERLAAGWDNEVYRLGGDLVARLPRRAAAVALMEHELRWMPSLASGLPLPVAAPLRAGHASERYPWPWSICAWLPGDIAATHPPADPRGAAEMLGTFVHAFRRPAPPDAPVNPARGIPLAARDELFESALGVVADHVPVTEVRAAWRDALGIETWQGPPQWLHGDLHPANVLVHNALLSAVIDFGDLTAGDPAGDLFIAWMMFDAGDRPAFRNTAAVDDETWARGRGWALALAVALLASADHHPRLVPVARRALAAVLADR